MDTIQISKTAFISTAEINLSAIRSSGPGGQHVNKVATGILLRFNIAQSSLAEDVKQLLLRKLAHRISKDGDIIIKVQQSRSQEQNRLLALQSLQQLLKAALIIQPPRKRTKPKKGAVEDRLQHKKVRGKIKEMRQKIDY